MNESRLLRVGHIGTGWTDRVQIAAFRLGGLKPQAICSGHRENAERVARKHGIPEVYTHWQELIESPDVDIISIVTPPALHQEQAVAALQAGKHVICEKPTALSVAEAEAMLAAAQAAPEQMAIIDHELRFHPLRSKMRQLLRDGDIGDIVLLEMDWLFPSRLDATLPWSWQFDAERGGGMLGAIGSHLFDLARWMIGRVDALTAQLTTIHLRRHDPETSLMRHVTADDHAQLFLKFANGASGNIRISAIQPEVHGMRIQVVGTEGILKIDFDDKLWIKPIDKDSTGDGNSRLSRHWQAVDPDEPMIDPARLPNASPFTIGSYYLARSVAESLAEGAVQVSDAASFYDGLVVQRAMDAARMSNREGTWVRL